MVGWPQFSWSLKPHFKALIVKQLKTIPSDRELYRRLWNDEELRTICDIEEHEKPYHPSQLTRFRSRVGPERLECIMASLLEELVEGDTKIQLEKHARCLRNTRARATLTDD